MYHVTSNLLDHPRRLFDDPLVTEFREDSIYRFEIIANRRFGLKMSIHARKMEVLGVMDDINGDYGNIQKEHPCVILRHLIHQA